MKTPYYDHAYPAIGGIINNTYFDTDNQESSLDRKSVV